MRSLSLSSERFEALARALIELSVSYLEKLPQLPTYPPGITGLDTERLFAGDAPAEGIGDEAFHALASIFEHSRPASPRFFGYVFGSGEPIGMLGEFGATVLHQNVTAWRSAPAAVTIERTVVRWLADAIGCYEYTGSLTLGGSSANLMGLCMAREAKAPANQSGTRSGSVLYCSSEAHMSIQKAAALLGLGHDAVRLIEVDEMFRMPTERLRQAIMHDLENGKTPIAVVASAGTTTTGNLRAQVKYGLAPWQALETATSLPAKAYGLESDLGTLESGHLADLIIVAGDPLKNINDVTRVQCVAKNGKLQSVADIMAPFAKSNIGESICPAK
jgi:hypothetical protein